MSRPIAVLALILLIFAKMATASAVHEAAQQGDLAALKKLVAANPKCINEKAPDSQWTPLHCAMLAVSWTQPDLQRSLAVVNFLISKGANLNAKDKNGDTALHFAINVRKTTVARLLISHGAKVNVVNNRGESVLHRSAATVPASADRDLTELIISKGGKVNAKDNDGLTPLARARQSGNMSAQQTLLRHGGK